MSNHLHLLLGVVELVDKSPPGVGLSRDREASQQVPRPDGPVPHPEPRHPGRLGGARPGPNALLMGQATAELKSRHPADDVRLRQPGAAAGREAARHLVRGDGRSEELTVRLDRLPGLGELTPREHKALMWELGRHRRRSPPAAEEGWPAGAGSRGGALRRPDDAP
ncbi:MAG: hypothetical protein R3F43_11365 [bacterium]